MGRVAKPARGKRRASLKKARAKALLSLFVLAGTAMTANSAGADQTPSNDNTLRQPEPVVVHLNERDREAAAKMDSVAKYLIEDGEKSLSQAAQGALDDYRAEIRAHENFEKFEKLINEINPKMTAHLPQGTRIEDLVDILQIDLDKWDADIADPVATTAAEREALAGKRYLGDGPSRELFEKLFNADGDNTLFVEMDKYITGVDQSLVRMGGPVLVELDSRAFLKDCYDATEGLYGSVQERLKAATVMFSATSAFSSIRAGYMPLPMALNGYSTHFKVSFDEGQSFEEFQLVVSPAFKAVHRSQLIAYMAGLKDPNQHIERQMNDGDLTGARAIDIFANFHEIAHAYDAQSNGHYEPRGDDVENGDISHFESKNGDKLDTAHEVRHRHEVYADIFAAYHLIRKYGEAGIRLVEMQADIRAGALAQAALNTHAAELDKKDKVSGFVAYFNHEALAEVAAEARAQLGQGKAPFANMSNDDIARESLELARQHTKDMAYYKQALEAFRDVGVKMLAANVDERLEVLEDHLATVDPASVGHAVLSFYKQAIDDLTVQADELPAGANARELAMEDWIKGYEEAVGTIGNRRVAMDIFHGMITREFKDLVNKAIMSAAARGEQPTQDSIQAYLEENVKKVEGKARLALEERLAAIQAANALGAGMDTARQNINRFNDAANTSDTQTSANENKTKKKADQKAARKTAPSWRLG